MPLHVLQDPMLSPSRPEPGVLVLHLLDSCNLRCRHCYMEASATKRAHLPLDLVLRSLREASQLGISRVYLSGGEPFLYPEIDRVLVAAAKVELCLAISTNGTLIDSRAISAVKQARATVQVSIDGPARFHDAFRGQPGAFAASSTAVAALVAAGVPVVVVTTITRDNIGYLPWLADWASGTGVERLCVQPLLALGRGADIRERQLSSDQLCLLYLQLSDMGHHYRGRGLVVSMAYRTLEFLREHPCAAYLCESVHCHRGIAKEIKKLIVREDGVVFPEIANLSPRYSLGRIQEAPLSDLVARYFDGGYGDFQELCRRAYQEIVPAWKSPLIPWDEMLAERSWRSRSRNPETQAVDGVAERQSAAG